ncbi:MAG: phosphate butyryltransferase [Candidatus Aminicenantes bacterium]|nr:phosphate butyryltransferase [Candidatus Aminicenantes bacterium]
MRKLSEIETLVKSKKNFRMAVAYGQDEDTILAVKRAVDEKIIDAVIVGDEKVIRGLCSKLKVDPGLFEIVNEPDEKKSGDRAVRLIIEGKAEILMKGLISTPYYLKPILNKEYNLVGKNGVLSHTAILEVPTYDKLLLVSDVAMIPYPDLNQKVQMIQYNVKIAAKLGIENPRVALLTANEKVSDKMPCTMEAAIISKMAERKQIKGAIVDGPLALDVAISPRALEVKGLKSVVEGHADILIMPNIEAGNIFYKATTILAQGKLAAVVTGAAFPAILTSRADDDDSKYYSIVLAAALV